MTFTSFSHFEGLNDIIRFLTKLRKQALCIRAESCEMALGTLRKATDNLPDVIFLDLNMPRMRGKTCLCELKKDKVLQGIPVIIYTTSSILKDKDETRALGASHFITKPTSYKLLCSEIQNGVDLVTT